MLEKQPLKTTPGDDLHLTLLMAPYGLNNVTGGTRKDLLAYGKAAFDAGQNAQPDALRKDAERYRWLSLQDLTYLTLVYVMDTWHDGEFCVDMGDSSHYGATLDDAIDAAIAQAVQ